MLQKEDGEKQPLSLSMNIKDGVATSDVFQMEDYGEYSYDNSMKGDENNEQKS